MNDNELAYLMTLKQNRLVPIVKCKYELPCGMCDRTGEVCSQYDYLKMKGEEE